MTATITEFTDPLCTWCWGMEPVLRRIEELYADAVEFEFVMGGLVETFETFHDGANDVSTPADVAPHWEAAADQHGMPVDADVWRTDPPESSYPASIAYEAATFQGEDVGDRYLRRLREAVATERRNIAEREVLLDLAADVGFDVDRFRTAFEGDRARAAFERDRQRTRESPVRAFPTFRLSGDDAADARWLRGARSFDAFERALRALGFERAREKPRPLGRFLTAHGRVTTQEVAEVYDLDHAQAVQTLRTLADEGRVQSTEAGSGSFWEPS